MDKLTKHLKEQYKLLELQDQDSSFKFLKRWEGKKVWVRFVDESDNKIIKLKSGGHNDPSGTYAFPIDWVLSKWFNGGSPFFGLKWIQILEDTSSNKLVLNKVKKLSDAESLLSKMGISLERNLKEAEKEVRKTFRGLANKKLLDREKDKISPVLFWGLVSGSNKSDKQRQLWLKAGFDCLEDRGNPTVVHPDEPKQIIFLKLSSYKVVSSYEQKRGDKQVTLLRKFIVKLFERLEEKPVKWKKEEPSFEGSKQIVLKALGGESSITVIWKPRDGEKWDIMVSIYGPKISVDFGREIFSLEDINMSFEDLIERVVSYYAIGEKVSSDKMYYGKQTW